KPGSGPVLGTFSVSHMPFALDLANDSTTRSTTPTLPEMMQAALAHLSQAGDGFVLQVEGVRVDHAAHGNYPSAILFEQLDFDLCVGIGRECAASHPDTLVIVTTDHGTGGYMLNGHGPDYNLSTGSFLKLGNAHSSYERFMGMLPQKPDPAAFAALVESQLG